MLRIREVKEIKDARRAKERTVKIDKGKEVKR